MELESGAGSGISRSQNIVYVLPHDSASVREFLGPPLERVQEGSEELQLLIVTADAETAIELVAATGQLTTGRPVAAVPATSAGRAARLLRARPAHIVAGAPEVLLALLESSVLKLDRVRSVVLAWADDVLASGQGGALESIMTEIPKDAPRVLVAGDMTPQVDQIVERYLRRAPRVTAPVAEGLAAVDLQYVMVAPSARASALRRLLDELDPEGAEIFVRSEGAEQDVERVLRHLGYGHDASPVRVTRGETRGAAPLLILHELPASRQQLAGLLESERRTVIAMVQPRQLGALRAVTGGGRLTPVTLPGAAGRARARDDAVRDELRELLSEGTPARELLALEPLLEEYDGAEIAAAALRLLERQRATAALGAATTHVGAAPSAVSGAGAWTRVFINVGTRDNARAGDLMGAIAGESGITRQEIGRIELRDTHALVEIAPAAAERVISSLTGSSIKGRRVVARIDAERPSRGGERERPARGAPRGDRGERPSREGVSRSGDRDRGRGERRSPHGDGASRASPRQGRRPPRRDDG